MPLFFRTRKKIAWCIPVLVFLLFFQPFSVIPGMAGLVNAILEGWNATHEMTVSLMHVSCTVRDMEAAITCMGCLLALLLETSIYRENPIVHDVLLFISCILMLVIQQFSALGIALLVCSRFSLVFFTHTLIVPTNRIAGLTLVCGLVLFSSLFYGNVQQMTVVRESVKEGVHTLRYGENVLPRGDLYASDMMQSQDSIMMTVQATDAKNTYLKGYVGSVYSQGEWTALPSSVFTQENAGLLAWLKQHHFDPFYQVSAYYSLSDEEDRPDENTIQVNVENASRELVYVPQGLSSVSIEKLEEIQDQHFHFTAIFPERKYRDTEISSSKPSELTIAADWVENPVSEEQKEYVEAESMYRTFVYNTYAVADTSLYPLMKEIFWDDYTSDSDGIYSAVNHVRKCLEKIECTEEVESSDEDPITLFLRGKIHGNSMYYASSAVQALRAHGIPARYVEGYYIPEERFNRNPEGIVSVTGQDQHAWVEIYFDGIGWLPVDVTPGYYYDAVRLQEMVALPNAVHKTAMAVPEQLQAEQFNAESETGRKRFLEELSDIRNLPLLTLGVIGFMAIVLTLAWCLLEMHRVLALYKLGYTYANGDCKRKCQILEDSLDFTMKEIGHTHVLGWNTEKTDAILTERMPQVQAGQYTEVSGLLEKVIYGDQNLEVYEQRTLDHFFREMRLTINGQSFMEKLRIRYACVRFYMKNRKKWK